MPDDCFAVKSFRTFVESSSAYSALQSELSNLLNFAAWRIQIAYFNEIKRSFENEQPLIDAINKVTIQHAMLDKMLFFVEDAIDQILDDLKERFEDEAYVSGESDESMEIDDVDHDDKIKMVNMYIICY